MNVQIRIGLCLCNRSDLARNAGRIALFRCGGGARKCGTVVGLCVVTHISYWCSLGCRICNVAPLSPTSERCERPDRTKIAGATRYGLLSTPATRELTASEEKPLQSWLQIGSKTGVIWLHFRSFVRVRLAESTGLSWFPFRLITQRS